MVCRPFTLLRGRGWSPLVVLCLAGAALPGLAGCVQPQTRLQKDEEPPRKKGPEIQTVGDVTEVANTDPLVVSGVGLVTGLDGTGGGCPAGSYRTLLETELKKRGFENVRHILESPDNAMVFVTARIPAGGHKGDRLDLDVTLPPGSRATSLRGGYLQECSLFNFDTTKHLNPEYEGSNKFLKGHVLAHARGPVLVGAGAKDEAVRMRKGAVWGGGVSLIDRPFYLTLKNDQQFARIANAVAERINQTFRDDNRKRLMVLGQVTGQLTGRFDGPDHASDGKTARAMNREAVFVRVPWEYRLNPIRYLRVARLIPLQDSAEVHSRYRQRLEKRLLDPGQAVSAALRLEALGNESIPALKAGLQSPHPLVRFCAAESLAYLGSPAGGHELAKLIKEYPRLRTFCLTALSSLNESVCHVELTDLLSSPVPEVRYGAFCALRTMDERDPDLRGELLNDSFWLHRQAPASSPLVHLSSSRRAEVVLFGEEPSFVPPFSLVAAEFTVTAGRDDNRCIVAHFSANRGAVQRRACSLKVEDVLKALADLGGTYTEAVDVLDQAGKYRCLNCPVQVNALPVLTPVEELVENAKNSDYWKTVPTEDEELTQTSAPARPAGTAPPAQALAAGTRGRQ